ncbi:MCP four helix bundle domain-containing protein [Oceanospirillum sp. HFRX-1_2]
MSRINNIKISHKLMISFGLILGLLMTISATGYQGLTQSDKGFNGYRELARDSILAGRLQANLLMLQSNFNRYLLTQSPDAYNSFSKRMTLMHQFLDQSMKEIQKPERARKLDSGTIISNQISKQ